MQFLAIDGTLLGTLLGDGEIKDGMGLGTVDGSTQCGIMTCTLKLFSTASNDKTCI